MNRDGWTRTIYGPDRTTTVRSCGCKEHALGTTIEFVDCDDHAALKRYRDLEKAARIECGRHDQEETPCELCVAVAALDGKG